MRDVVDPELGINVVDLGLVYGVSVDDDNIATIDMTLTSAACPLTDVIEDQTRQALDGLRHRLPDQLGLDAAVGPGQDHRRRPRAAARPRLQRLTVTHCMITTGSGGCSHPPRTPVVIMQSITIPVVIMQCVTRSA